MQAVPSQTTIIRCDRLFFMAWTSSNQHLKFPNAEILTIKPEEMDFSSDFLGFDL